MSERITFTAGEEVVEILDAVEQQPDIDSTAGAVRECIKQSARLQREYAALQHLRARDAAEYEQEIAALERDLEHARARQDELRAMLKAANRRNEETQALVEYVEQQDRSVVERLKSWFK